MKKTFTKIFSVILLITLVFSLAACGKKQTSEPETKLEKIKEAGKIVLGTCADYPPYEFHKQVDGKDTIVGFDIEIAKEIAKDLGVELEIKDMKFDGLLAALQTGNIDFIVAGMVPTEDRKQSVDFSEIYYKAVQSVVVRTEDKDKLTTIDSLKGLKVGAQKSTTQETIVQEQMKDSQLKSLSKITDLVLEIKNKKIDALVLELPVAQAYVNANEDLVVSQVEVENKDKGSAIAIAKGNEDLLEIVNKTLEKLVTAGSIDEFVADANELVE